MQNYNRGVLISFFTLHHICKQTSLKQLDKTMENMYKTIYKSSVKNILEKVEIDRTDISFYHNVVC